MERGNLFAADAETRAGFFMGETLAWRGVAGSRATLCLRAVFAAGGVDRDHNVCCAAGAIYAFSARPFSGLARGDDALPDFIDRAAGIVFAVSILPVMPAS